MKFDGVDVLVLVLALVCGPLLLFALYLLVVMVPVMAYNEAECLRNGYPKHAVSIGLERYCMTLDGAVTVRVDKANKGQ